MRRWLWVGFLVMCWTAEVRGQPELPGPETEKAAPSPKGALLRSAALPGWGQFYNHKRLKGAGFILLEASLLTGVLLERDASQSGGLSSLGSTLLLGLIGVRTYGMVDAYVDAHFVDFDQPDILGAAARRSVSGVAIGIRVRW